MNESKWEKATEWEKNWWGNCVNSLNEEEKQKGYVPRLGLSWSYNNKTPYIIDACGKSVIDIGGGPVSLLLKTTNVKNPLVVDPCEYPQWIYQRYETAGIKYLINKAEDLLLDIIYDEVWMYNVLQHTDDPELIINNAKKISKLIRIFDWLDCGTNQGHPHNLTLEKMNEWLGGNGKVEFLNERGLKGKAYYGIFKGDKY